MNIESRTPSVKELFEEWSKQFDGTTLSPLWGSERIVARQAFLEAHSLATRATAERFLAIIADDDVLETKDYRWLRDKIRFEFLTSGKDGGGGD